jgi:lactoylglutathione lyase
METGARARAPRGQPTIHVWIESLVMTDEPRPRFGAAGIGVTDLARSTEFYQRVFGPTTLMTFALPDMDETVLGFGGRGAAVVLMQHTDGVERDLANTGGKLVFYVPDPAAVAAAIRAEGCEIVREPAPVPELRDAVVGFGMDPDGHLIEILQA